MGQWGNEVMSQWAMGQWGNGAMRHGRQNLQRLVGRAKRARMLRGSLSGIRLALCAKVREGLDQLEDRTKRFAIEVACLCAKLEGMRGLRQVAWQLADAAGSVASNHRAMRRSRSEREFAAKLQIVNEEVDESALWLEIALAVFERNGQGPVPNWTASSATGGDLTTILREARELRSIFAKARATLRHRHDPETSHSFPASHCLIASLPHCLIASLPHCRRPHFLSTYFFTSFCPTSAP